MIARYATSGPVLVMPARSAALLERMLRVDELRLRVRGQDPEIDEVLLAWRAVAAQYVDEAREQVQFRACGTTVEQSRNSADAWTTNEVAARTDCTARGVRKAAQRGQLQGTQDTAGRWRFAHNDVALWVAARTKENR